MRQTTSTPETLVVSLSVSPCTSPLNHRTYPICFTYRGIFRRRPHLPSGNAPAQDYISDGAVVFGNKGPTTIVLLFPSSLFAFPNGIHSRYKALRHTNQLFRLMSSWQSGWLLIALVVRSHLLAAQPICVMQEACRAAKNTVWYF
jgi:hypothetical protein